EEESEVVPNLMLGFGIDEIQAEYVAEIKLRHLNREYILKRLQDIEKLTEEIADMQDILEHKSRIRKIITDELKDVIKKYGQPRKSEICYDAVADAPDEAEEIPDYPVHLFFTKEGYFKKITPQSLRMSGEQKLKDGDEIIFTLETTNSRELLFFTDRCNVYKSRANDFSDTKASAMGDFVPTKLEMEEGEMPIFLVVVEKYEGNMLFFFENGKIAKVDMASYITKSNRKRLINAYCSKSPLTDMRYAEQDGNYVLVSSDTRRLVFNSAAISSKSMKDTQGVAVMTLRKGKVLSRVSDFKEDMFVKPQRYMTKSLPSTGALLSADDKALEENKKE
ncbi:MAG: topoisomerase IV, partial [Clostridia bacterium]|nr:topoisomerase IV [Clostridia bacterium]